jgi:tRNA 5-methylaminomethyl-2-thiouridine biosynthesis bifunctional protein
MPLPFRLHSAQPEVNLPWNTVESSTAPLTAGERPLQRPGHDGNADIEPIVILGAGLAGCWLARLLAEQGIQTQLIDAHASVGKGASGNPAGIVKPYVTRTPCLPMDFHIAAHAYLLTQLQALPELRQTTITNALYNATGVLQLVEHAYPESPYYDSVSKEKAQDIAGVSLAAQALYFDNSGWLNPKALCRALVKHSKITLSTGCKVSSILRIQSSTGLPCWQVCMNQGRDLWTSRLVLACGSALNRFPQTQSLPVIAARGQISRFQLKHNSPAPRCVINGKHYIIPDGDTVLVGATFDRGNTDDQIQLQDHARNLCGMRETVPSLQVHDLAVAGYAGVRATTPDRLPMVGPAPDNERLGVVYGDLKHGRSVEHYPALPCHEGLFVLGGLGSRGIVSAPMAARILADMLTGKGCESWERWSPLLNPARFQIRNLKRGKQRSDGLIQLD